MHAEPSHWPHETFISKTVCHHFWPGVMADPQTGGESLGQEIFVCYFSGPEDSNLL